MSEDASHQDDDYGPEDTAPPAGDPWREDRASPTRASAPGGESTEAEPGEVNPDPVVPLARRTGELPIGRLAPVHPDHVTVSRLAQLFSSLVFAAVVAIALFALVFTDSWPPALRIVGAVLGLALIVGRFALAWWWPPRAWNRLRYRVDATGLEIVRGVIWRETVVVACSRIQHTEVTRGPLERSRGLASLVVHTAGTTHDTIELPGLGERTAYELRDWLIAASADARRS